MVAASVSDAHQTPDSKWSETMCAPRAMKREIKEPKPRVGTNANRETEARLASIFRDRAAPDDGNRGALTLVFSGRMLSTRITRSIHDFSSSATHRDKGTKHQLCPLRWSP